MRVLINSLICQQSNGEALKGNQLLGRDGDEKEMKGLNRNLKGGR